MLARELAEECIERLAKIVRRGSERVAVAAVQVILDRGWGKPTTDGLERAEVIALMSKLGQAVDLYVADPDVRQRIADTWAAEYAGVAGAPDPG